MSDPGSPLRDPPVLLGVMGALLLVGAFAILVGPTQFTDPLPSAIALLVAGCALLGVSLWRPRWPRGDR